MEFDHLPPEMVLKIFSYLPQHFLEVVAQVSKRWMQLAFDPSLYTMVCIDAAQGDSAPQMRKILERATMLRTLQITAAAADFEAIALSSPGLWLLKNLVIPGSAISHRAMPGILEQCKSLTEMVLFGQHSLAARDVRILETLPSLRRFVTSDDVVIRDDVLQQICCSCPRLESLEINSEEISRNESWDYLGGLHHLRVLSVNVISTADLLHVSKSCPGLETLKIDFVVNENDISMAEALQGFLRLRSLCVILECGQGWLDERFGTPPLLKCFEVPRLVLEEEQFQRLILSLWETLQHITIDVSMIPDGLLCPLSFCKNLQCLQMYGLTGKSHVFSIVSQLPRLVRVSLYVVADPADAIYKLISIVDTQDKSPRGRTRLICNVLSSSPDAQDKIMRAANAFRDCLVKHTSMTTQHISEFDGQCLKCDGVSGPPWKVETSFPTVSPTLKYLILDLDNV